MVKAKQLQKHALECLRLEADCMHLASFAHSPNVQSHFVAMARVWGALADTGPSSDTGSKFQSRDTCNMTRKLPRVVLIVEHDELLKFVTADIMQEAGFVALQASDAVEAIAILETRHDVALLLTGVTMPGSMDGLGLAHTVCKRWPTVKIVIASSQIRLAGPSLPKNSSFFLKPYNAQRMVSEIQSLIGR